jgi:hypothetical protein
MVLYFFLVGLNILQSNLPSDILNLSSSLDVTGSSSRPYNKTLKMIKNKYLTMITKMNVKCMLDM